jgi:hypothetical protein
MARPKESADQQLNATSVSPELQRKLATLAFLGVIVAALVGALGSIAAAYVTIIPRLPLQEHIYFAHLSAAAYPFANTNVPLEKDDDVQIIVQGADAYWNCGKGNTSPEGILGDKTEQTIVPSANHCELVGYIREGVPFRVGSYEEFKATESGSLYLGANDEPTSDCFKDSPGSTCFKDNAGMLAVKIIVRKEKWRCAN